MLDGERREPTATTADARTDDDRRSASLSLSVYRCRAVVYAPPTWERASGGPMLPGYATTPGAPTRGRSRDSSPVTPPSTSHLTRLRSWGNAPGLPAAIRCIRGIVSTHPFAGYAALAAGTGLHPRNDWNVAAFPVEQGFALLPFWSIYIYVYMYYIYIYIRDKSCT